MAPRFFFIIFTNFTCLQSPKSARPLNPLSTHLVFRKSNIKMGSLDSKPWNELISLEDDVKFHTGINNLLMFVHFHSALKVCSSVQCSAVQNKLAANLITP